MTSQPSPDRAARAPAGPSFVDLFTPKIVTVFCEGYGLGDLRADAVAALTVAIVALPLSMAIAIASGTTPDRGLFTAIVGAIVVSALGGSRFQIAGPAGAFIVLVASVAARHGIEGVIVATMMAGVFLAAAGFLRLGTYVKFIPYPVTVGFTAGIAVTILASQFHDLLGLTLTGKEPGELLPKLEVLGAALPTASFAAIALSALSIGVIAAVRRWRPHWPGMLIAVVLVSGAAVLLQLPVETIGSKFGGIPRTLPLPSLPHVSLDFLVTMLPDALAFALAFALLGAIKSLLSAVVADSITGRRHRSNCELVAQGAANVASGLFGGICVTGTIARTVTNVRAGARGPISGILHSLFLLAFMLVAAPLAKYIPLAALAGVLAVVAWNMAEKHAIATLLRSSKGDALVLAATFFLTIFRDLTTGILVGFGLGALLFLHRMAQATSIESTAWSADDVADATHDQGHNYDPALATDRDLVIVRVTGAFFFGAAANIGAALDRIADLPKTFILDFAAVPFLDSTAAKTVEVTALRAQKHGVRLIVTGASPHIVENLAAHGVHAPLVAFAPSIDAAVARIAAERAATAASPAANPSAVLPA